MLNWLSDLCFRTTVNDPVSGNTYEIGDTPLGGVYTSPQYCLSSKPPCFWYFKTNKKKMQYVVSVRLQRQEKTIRSPTTLPHN
jgi:hypothetical protein